MHKYVFAGQIYERGSQNPVELYGAFSSNMYKEICGSLIIPGDEEISALNGLWLPKRKEINIDSFGKFFFRKNGNIWSGRNPETESEFTNIELRLFSLESNTKGLIKLINPLYLQLKLF